MKRVLHAGWLTKSPPERKTHGPWKIFKSHWRRRYFVLSSVHASSKLPGTCPAQLEYYDNERQTKLKGSINLNSCEQVVVHLESEYYRHVFIIRTTDRGRDRTYYLAADNERDMERWVEQLCSILNLQDDAPPPQTLPPMSSVVSSTSRTNSVTPSTVSSGVSSSVVSAFSINVEKFDSPPESLNQQQGDYLPLEHCSSGPPPVVAPRNHPTPVRVVTIRSQTTQDSTSTASHSSNDFTDHDDIYNHPRVHYQSSDIYKYPRSQEDRDSEVYKVPVFHDEKNREYDYPHSLSSTTSTSMSFDRDSNYDYPPPAKSKNGHDRDSNYDYPPSARVPQAEDDDEQPIWECQSRQPSMDSSVFHQCDSTAGDTYDLLPPKSHSIDPHRFPNGANPVTSHASSAAEDVYDLPGSSLPVVIAPPRPHMMPKVHRYVNAAPTPVVGSHTSPPKSPIGQIEDDNVYLAMGSVVTINDIYLPMSQMERAGNQKMNLLTSKPPKKHGGIIHSTSHVISRDCDTLPKVPMKQPRSSGNQANEFDSLDRRSQFLVDSVHGNHRTRSFKRHTSVPSTESVVLPQKKGGMTEDSSSSDDEDSNSAGSESAQNYINLQNITGSHPSSPNSAPPPPPKSVVQYLDLDLDASSMLSHTATGSTDVENKIEYNEIDIEKTKALFDAKLMLENERKGSE